ncbi:hypothetical protein GCK32_005881 [Trichostrongylus colubriformis]|uniref:Peptidase M13 C-terminal domain-containing protein n=1 Tax=Trichostrongylus colubriformis TaxID=6319 RepID=A0AAN8FJL5_TRICO
MNFCAKMSDFSLYRQLDKEHSPGMYRVNTVISNFPPFGQAFFCSPTSPMANGSECSLW